MSKKIIPLSELKTTDGQYLRDILNEYIAKQIHHIVKPLNENIDLQDQLIKKLDYQINLLQEINKTLKEKLSMNTNIQMWVENSPEKRTN